MKEVDFILHKYIEDNNAPCLHYVIFNKDKIVHRFTSGFADIKNQKRVDENSTFHAYSVTKTFTALAVMQLAERKLLEIERPVKIYDPDFPYSPDITIRQLLTHSSGIPNPIPLSWIHLPQEHASFKGNIFFNQLFTKNKQIKFKPNEKYKYSNLGYVLLGQLIERVSGMAYEQYISENILKKLELDSKELGFTLYNNGRHAKGYQKRFSFSNLILTFFINKSKFMDKPEGNWKPFKDLYVNGVSYGGLIGTSNAFVKYIQELLKPTCRLISDSYKKLLFEENYTRNNQATGMCLSWFSGKFKGETYFAHAGGGGGYYCEIRIYPKQDLGSVIMFNRTGMSDERFLNKTDQYFINEKKSNR